MEKQERWVEEILCGIDRVPIHGIPGTIVVYGHQAAPILSSESPSDLIIAAAELGKGRVVVFSHDCYFHQFLTNEDSLFTKLNINLKSWLFPSKDTTACSLEGVKSVPNNGSGILLWRGSDKKNDKFYTDLLTFVRNGGGLLLAMTPWGYLQLQGGTLEEMPMFQILKEIGISYTDGYYGGPNPLPVKENNAHMSHLALLLRMDISNTGDSVCKLVSQAFCHIPKDALEQFSCIIMPEFSINTCFPSVANPAKGQNKIKLSMYLAMLRMRGKCEKIAGCGVFPGDCILNCPLETAIVEVFSEKDHFHVTGYYLPPGVPMTVTVLAVKNQTDWYIRVGAHSDNISDHNEWKRWPNICTTTQLNKPTMEISSHFGGLIYISGPKDKTKLQIMMDQVVKAPYYNLCDPVNVMEWNERRMSPAPWADLVGKNIIFTLPSKVVAGIDPKEAIEFWDTVVQAHYELRGVDLGRQWCVPDVQPSAGYMHSGYPIVTHMDVAEPENDNFVLNVAGLNKTGSWGLFHELGHNLQSECWTFDGAVEVTCNIFTLHAMDTICGLKPWIHNWLENSLSTAQNYLKDSASFSLWQEKPGLALFIYAQLARDFGWKAYRRVFREYELLPAEEKPETTQQKIDQWIIRVSTVTDRNLMPLFEFWGFPLTEECGYFVNFLQPYLPDDELTRYADQTVREILKKYSGVDRCGHII